MAGDWADFVSTFDLTPLLANATEANIAVAGDGAASEKGTAARVIGAEQHELFPLYNIAPSAQAGHEVPVLRASGLQKGRFWFVPKWWKKDLRQVPTAFNAKSEELNEKPYFRGYEKVLIPTSGWREFPGPAGKKRSFAFERGARSAGKGRFFAFGGIGSSFFDPATGEEVFGFAILTTAASAWMQPYHPRMPLLVPPSQYSAWRDSKVLLEELLFDATFETQHAHEAGHPLSLSHYECSTLGNHTAAQGEECIWPIDRVLNHPELSARLQAAKSAGRKASAGSRKKGNPADGAQRSLFDDD